MNFFWIDIPNIYVVIILMLPHGLLEPIKVWWGCEDDTEWHSVIFIYCHRCTLIVIPSSSRMQHCRGVHCWAPEIKPWCHTSCRHHQSVNTSQSRCHEENIGLCGKFCFLVSTFSALSYKYQDSGCWLDPNWSNLFNPTQVGSY